MKSHVWQPCPFKDGLKLFCNTPIVQWRPKRCGEDQVIFLPACSSDSLCLLLAFTMSRELADGGATEFYMSSPCFGLGRRKHIPLVFHLLKLALDVQVAT